MLVPIEIRNLHVFVSLMWLCLVAIASAQSQERTSKTSILDEQALKPAFRIEPIVHRLTARRGQVLRFEHEITSLTESTLAIQPIAITQRLNGVIASDANAPVPTAIQLETPATVNLKAGEKHLVRGQLRVPLDDATFHSFGILVRDQGRKQPNRGTSNTQLGVSFVTQYLLRCDVSVQGTIGAELDSIRVQRVNIVEENGLPMMLAEIVNPTANPMEFQLNGILTDLHGARSVPLWMPVRAASSEPEKFDIRILGHTTLQVSAEIPFPLEDGTYHTSFEAVDLQRHLKSASSFGEIKVAAANFPMQHQRGVAIAPGITASPGVIELSTLRGGDRLVAVTLSNYSDEPQTIELDSRDAESNLIPSWLIVRPSRLTIPAGRERKVMVSMRSAPDSSGNRYATLSSTNGHGKLTVASMTTDATVELKHQEPVWAIQDGQHSIQLALENHGDVHAIVDASLDIIELSGRRQNIDQSWARWILPNEAATLSFPMRRLPAGQYRLIFEVKDRTSGERIELQRGLEVPSDVK